MSKRHYKNNIFVVIVFVLCVVLIAALGIKIVKTEKESDTKRLSFVSYLIGSIDNYGYAEDSRFAFRTDFIESDKIDKIELEKDSFLKYKVFFYDDEKTFISSTDYLTTYLTEIPKTEIMSYAYGKYRVGDSVNVTYCRIACQVPEDKEKVSVVTLPAYSNQIIVMIKK